MGLDELNAIPSTEELLAPFERRGEQIQKPTEFESLGIEDGAVFHERLQSAGKKLSNEALSLLPLATNEKIIPFGAEIIDDHVPLVLLSYIFPEYKRVDFQLIKPPSDALDKMNDPDYLFKHCSLHAEEQQGDLISEMAFSDFGDNDWYQHHRRTNAKFSHQNDATGVPIRMGREMLASSENVPELSAKIDDETKTAWFNPYQLGSMRWALQNGYEIATPEDEELWQRVQAGDEAFYVKDDTDYGENKPDCLYWKNPKEKDPNWKENYDPLVRIRFEKKFAPEKKESWEAVDDAVKNVRENIGNVPGIK